MCVSLPASTFFSSFSIFKYSSTRCVTSFCQSLRNHEHEFRFYYVIEYFFWCYHNKIGNWRMRKEKMSRFSGVAVEPLSIGDEKVWISNSSVDVVIDLSLFPFFIYVNLECKSATANKQLHSFSKHWCVRVFLLLLSKIILAENISKSFNRLVWIDIWTKCISVFFSRYLGYTHWNWSFFASFLFILIFGSIALHW